MVAVTMAVALATGCTESDPEPVVLSDEEMVAAFEARATGYHDAILPVLTDMIREFNAGSHGAGDSLFRSETLSLADEPRLQELCEQMVAVENEFDATFAGVERTPRYDELRYLHDDMPDIDEPGVVVALISEGMIAVDGFSQSSEFRLVDRFPEPIYEYNDLEVTSSGTLNGWRVSKVDSFTRRKFYNTVADCFFDTLESERSD